MEPAVVLLSIVSILVVLSNGLVCGLIMGCKKLRTPSNALIMSLAASDLVTGGVLVPIVLAVPASPVAGYLIAAVLIIGVASVCFISLDRYMAVLRPFRYHPFMRHHFVKMIAATWSVPIVITLLPLLWQSYLLVHRIYLFSLCILFIIMPYFFVFVAYFRIFRQIRVHSKMLESHTKTNFINQKRLQPAEAKVVKVFFRIVILFLVSWSPILYSTMAFACDRPDIVPSFLKTVSLFMLDLSSLLNPFLFCAGTTGIRSELKNLLMRKRAGKSPNRSEVYGCALPTRQANHVI